MLPDNRGVTVLAVAKYTRTFDPPIRNETKRRVTFTSRLFNEPAVRKIFNNVHPDQECLSSFVRVVSPNDTIETVRVIRYRRTDQEDLEQFCGTFRCNGIVKHRVRRKQGSCL